MRWQLNCENKYLHNVHLWPFYTVLPYSYTQTPDTPMINTSDQSMWIHLTTAGGVIMTAWEKRMQINHHFVLMTMPKQKTSPLNTGRVCWGLGGAHSVRENVTTGKTVEVNAAGSSESAVCNTSVPPTDNCSQTHKAVRLSFESSVWQTTRKGW